METRQERLRGWKNAGKKLSNSTVAVVGVGGIGCSAALELATAGVNLKLIDRDIVEKSNLGHQLLYGSADVDFPKPSVAAAKLGEKNPGISVKGLAEDLQGGNAEELLAGVDAIVDGTDNLETRRLLNEVSIKLRVPLTYAAVVGTEGLFSFFVPGKTCCLSCFLTKKPATLDTCESAGVLGPLAALAGSLSAAAVLTYLATSRIIFKNRLIGIDLQEGAFDTVSLEKRKDCDVCCKRKFTELKRKQNAVSLCGGFFQVNGPPVELMDLATKAAEHEICEMKAGALKVEMGKKMVWFFPTGRAMVKGVASAAAARSLVAKLRGV